MIARFAGEYRFLSNFYPAKVILDGVVYPTTEHAYQSAKSTDPDERITICGAPTPWEAKSLGRNVKLRGLWNQLKFGIMYDLVWQKFSLHEDLKKGLLETGDQELIEGNAWGDTIWGVCNGKGDNWLGLILMDVRKRLK